MKKSKNWNYLNSNTIAEGWKAAWGPIGEESVKEKTVPTNAGE